jgi:hypothetical protein
LKADAVDEDGLVSSHQGSVAIGAERPKEDGIVLSDVRKVDNAAECQDKVFIEGGR